MSFFLNIKYENLYTCIKVQNKFKVLSIEEILPGNLLFLMYTFLYYYHLYNIIFKTFINLKFLFFLKNLSFPLSNFYFADSKIY
jgi:hypothetical protein